MKQAINIGTAKAEPGKTGCGFLKVAELNDGSPVEVPVAIINGAADGARLWIQNGVHGDEYVGMAAIQELLAETDPAQVRGAVILIPMLNVLGYRAGHRSAPQDGMDMNRIWPGNPLDKAMHLWAHSELVVHAVLQQMVAHADCLLDVHDAGFMGVMSPYVAYYTGPQELYEKQKAVAFAAGMDLIWETQPGWVTEKVPGSVKLHMQRLGIPSVTLEVGGEGRLDRIAVERMVRAFKNIMKHLGIVPGEPELRPNPFFVTKGNWLRASRGGVLYKTVDVLEKVEKGQTVAVIRDFFGREVERLVSPCDGVVIGQRTLGQVSTGQYVCNVGELA